MVTRIFLLIFAFGTAAPAFAALPLKWEKIDHPSVDAFYKLNGSLEYITVVRNQSDDKMAFEGMNDAEIAHVITLLRRVSLKPFGIEKWEIAKLKFNPSKTTDVIEIDGSYLNKSGEKIQFSEKMFFKGKTYKQISWQKNTSDLITSSTTDSEKKTLFRSLEKDFE